MSNENFRLIPCALVCAFVLSVAGCKKPESAPPPGAGMPPPEVAVVVAQPRDIPVSYEYVGQIAGVREVEVRSRVSGILEKWNFIEGATVKAGQSLFVIDAAPFRAALEKAQADLATVEARHAQAERQVARLKPLFDEKMITQQAYDDAVSAEQIAAASVKSAKATVTEARLNLSYTRVEAPISGITSRAVKSEGSLVQEQQTLLTSISQIDTVHVVFSFTEAEHLKFSRASADGALKLPKDGKFDVTLRLSDNSEYTHKGKVDFTDVRVDSATGTIEARAPMPNPQHLLRPGQFVRVKLGGALRSVAIAIPQRAVLEGPAGKIVMTVNAKGLVEPRPVQVGDWSEDEWVIDSGLAAGDKVIVDGVVKAQPGSPVSIAPAAPPKPSGAPPQPAKS